MAGGSRPHGKRRREAEGASGNRGRGAPTHTMKAFIGRRMRDSPFARPAGPAGAPALAAASPFIFMSPRGLSDSAQGQGPRPAITAGSALRGWLCSSLAYPASGLLMALQPGPAPRTLRRTRRLPLPGGGGGERERRCPAGRSRPPTGPRRPCSWQIDRSHWRCPRPHQPSATAGAPRPPGLFCTDPANGAAGAGRPATLGPRPARRPGPKFQLNPTPALPPSPAPRPGRHLPLRERVGAGLWRRVGSHPPRGTPDQPSRVLIALLPRSTWPLQSGSKQEAPTQPGAEELSAVGGSPSQSPTDKSPNWKTLSLPKDSTYLYYIQNAMSEVNSTFETRLQMSS